MRYAKEFILLDKDLTIGFWELRSFHVDINTSKIYFSLRGYLTADAQEEIVHYRVIGNLSDYTESLASNELVKEVIDSIESLNKDELMFN